MVKSKQKWHSRSFWGTGLAGSLLILVGGLSYDQSTLCVQAGSGWRYQVSQSAGERELGILSRTAHAEDAWLYLAGIWTDIGYGENRKNVHLDFGAVVAASEIYADGRLSAASDTALQPVFYHIHLLDEDSNLVDPPSLQDIHALALLKEECRALIGAELIGIMFDGRGKWVFDITRALEAGILLDEQMRRSGGGTAADFPASRGYVRRPDSASAFDLGYPPVVWAAMPGEVSRSRENRIRAFIEGARQLGLLVTYISFENDPVGLEDPPERLKAFSPKP